MNFISLPSQTNWQKAMYGLVMWILVVGEKGVEVVKKVEERSPTPLAASFGKVMEPLRVPEDMHEVADAMLAEDKPSVTMFNQKVRDVLLRRWWSWVLFHPQLQPQYVHPSRGVCSGVILCDDSQSIRNYESFPFQPARRRRSPSPTCC
jgi:hypothetical protein